MWSFRKSKSKEVTPTPPETKAASFLLNLGMGKFLANTAANYDQLAEEGYALNVVAYRCINLIANAAASVDLQLYRRVGSDLDQIESHELLDLLARPNAAQSGYEFRQWLASFFLVGGNAYVMGNGMDPNRRDSRPTELQILNPGKVKIEPAKSGFFPLRYEYRPSGNERLEYPVDQITGRSAVLHLKTFNPLSPWYGLSPIMAAAYDIDIFNSGQQWNKRLLDNNARPSGALVVKDKKGHTANLTEEQYNRLQQQIEQQFSGQNNAGRPMLLEGGLDWTEMSLNPKDVDWLDGKHSAARDVALAFGVPPQLIGIPGDATYNNFESAKLALWTDTVLPLLCLMLAGLDRWLTPSFGEDLFLWYDEEMIPALEPLRRQKSERIEKSSYLTINEKRRAMGMDDQEGGNVILVPAGMVPLELVGAVDLSEPDSPADNAIKPGDDDEE